MSAAKILLVDDEIPLLQLLEKHLTRLGYEVETHSKSEDALRSFEAAPGRYDLIIADLGMPGMPGDSMLTRMLEIQPSIPILICSGSPVFASKLAGAMEKQVGFLQKPFVPRMLSEAIDRLLGGRE